MLEGPSFSVFSAEYEEQRTRLLAICRHCQSVITCDLTPMQELELVSLTKNDDHQTIYWTRRQGPVDDPRGQRGRRDLRKGGSPGSQQRGLRGRGVKVPAAPAADTRPHRRYVRRVVTMPAACTLAGNSV
jgi:hypothetical protein